MSIPLQREKENNMIRSSNVFIRSVAFAGFGILGAVLARGQVPAAKPLMAEEVFKNIQVLKGIPVDEFMGTMGFFAAALSLNCTECHTADAINDLSEYATDTPLK